MDRLVDRGPGHPLEHVYIHVPFCVDRCTYCAFATVRNDPGTHELLIDALLAELSRHAPPAAALQTIYLGGGTPSVLPPAALGRLIDGVRRWAGPAMGCEVSLEANPSNVSGPSLRAWSAAGVTRLSIGIQTFDDTALKRLARRHTSSDAREALSEVAAHWRGTWSADLLVGWSGQTIDALAGDLDQLLAFDPPHVSVYGLTVEPRTALASMQRHGQTVTADSDTAHVRDEFWSRHLEEAGLERYEVSNFSRPGHRSRHNQAYWRNAEYLGVGPGASSSIGSLRWSNIIATNIYLDHVARGVSVRNHVERLTPAQRLMETLASGLRQRDGLSTDALEARFGSGWITPLLPAIAELRLYDLLKLTEEAISIPHESLCRSDSVIGLLVSRFSRK